MITRELEVTWRRYNQENFTKMDQILQFMVVGENPT